MTKMVTIATARRILGAPANKMSDEQLQELLDTMYVLAGENLLYDGSKKEDNSNEE